MDIPVATASTDNPASYARFFEHLHVPVSYSHKGQNGKVLVIGGSSLFHSALVWPAEVASHFADMVHVSSIEENNEIIRRMKIAWRNGIIVSQKDIPFYAAEDDVVLIGNGMMRTDGQFEPQTGIKEMSEILDLKDEGERTYYLTHRLLHAFPDKKWVLDAGALQMMEPEWLDHMHVPAIVTPHQKEFERLFGVKIADRDEADKVKMVEEAASRHRCVILLKSVYDIVSDGNRSYIIRGGNVGLTRGGTGDILAGIVTALYAKNKPVESAVAASVLLKLSAEALGQTKGIWYNNTDIIAELPKAMHRLMGQYNKTYRKISYLDTKA